FYLYWFFTGYIEYFCGSRQYNICAQNGFFSNPNTFNHNTTGAHESIVFNNYRGSLQWFQDAANANTSAEVHVFANLGATAHRGPRIDHSAFIYIGANVYVAWHHYYPFGNKSPMTGNRGRNHADSFGFIS